MTAWHRNLRFPSINCLRLRKRPLDRRARWVRSPQIDFAFRRGVRPGIFSRRFAHRLYGPLRREHWVKGTKWIRNASLSPSGARVALEYRGEILTLPREKGDDRNLTQTPGIHERSPAWSPDGKWIALFSDVQGEYVLRLLPQDGRGSARTIPLAGAGFYADPQWSPDSTKLSLTDNAHSIWMLDLGAETQTRVSSNVIYGPVPVLHHSWSADSRWLAYTRNTATYFNEIFLYSVADGDSFPVTDGLADARNPVFDANGKYLYLLASTDAGPVNDWFSQANADMRSMSHVYLAVLAKDQPSPLAPQSDEEKHEVEDPDAEDTGENPSADANADADNKDNSAADKADAEIRVVVDVEGLSQRVLAMQPVTFRRCQTRASTRRRFMASRRCRGQM